jgi:hypothetical protein
MDTKMKDIFHESGENMDLEFTSKRASLSSTSTVVSGDHFEVTVLTACGISNPQL